MNSYPHAFFKKRPALLLFLAAGLLGILIAAVFVIDGRPLLTFLGKFKQPSPATSLSSYDFRSPLKVQYASNELLVKIKEPQHKNVKPDPRPDNTGIVSLDKLNQSEKAKEFQGIARPSPSSKNKNHPVFRWYLITFPEEAEIVTEQFEFESESMFAQKLAQRTQLDGMPSLPANLHSRINKYRSDPNIEDVQPNYIATTLARPSKKTTTATSDFPNDPYWSSSGSWGQPYDDLWGLKKIQAEGAWNASQGEGVVVAVVDTGLDYTHPDVAENVWINPGEIPDNGIDDDGNGYVDDIRGWDFTRCEEIGPEGCVTFKAPDNDPMDDNLHGTHVAGTIAAVINNNRGIIGVSPKAKIMPVKGLNYQGAGYTSDLARALQYAADNGASVINNSWGCAWCQRLPIIEDAVKYAHNLDIVIIFAAGNAGWTVSGNSPQNQRETIVVSAFDENDDPTFFTDFGFWVDVAAPGGGKIDSISDFLNTYNILSLRSSQIRDATGLDPLYVGEHYLRLAGTSMAAPHVSGLAALIRAAHPEFSNEDIRQVLRVSADDVGESGTDAYAGAGRINAARAVSVNSVLKADITNPFRRTNVTGLSTFEIRGSASGTGFLKYELSYGLGTAPSQWVTFSVFSVPVTDGLLGTLDVNSLQFGGIYTLRLAVIDAAGRSFEDYSEVQLSRSLSGIRALTDAALPSTSYPPPRMYRQYIVWGAGSIYLYDLYADIKQQISPRATYQFAPDIDGNKIVWGEQDSFGGNTSLYVYDLSTRTERRIPGSDGANSWAIFGSKVVWSTGSVWTSAEERGVYLFDLDTDVGRQITPTSTLDRLYSGPDIHGNKIVWTLIRRMPDGNYRGGEMFLYDLSTNTEFQLTTEDPNQYSNEGGRIFENTVVWTRFPVINFSMDIMMHDIKTQITRKVTTDPEWQVFPVVSGNRIAWMDFRNMGPDIYAYDLDVFSEYPVVIAGTTLQGTLGRPEIFGRRLIWMNDYDKKLYLYEFSNHPPIIEDIAPQTVIEEETLTFTFRATDPDGDHLSYGAIYPPGGNLGGIFTDHKNGTVTFTWNPGLPAGSYLLAIAASDDQLSASRWVTITVLKDSDNDGFMDPIESYIGTDPLKACPATPAANDEPVDAWPPDFNDDTFVDIIDTSTIAGYFGKKVVDGAPRRYDLTADGVIDISDISLVADKFGQTCK